MTLSFLPDLAVLGNGARPSLHPLPNRVDHPSPLLLLTDDPHLGQRSQQLARGPVRGDQDAGAGWGGEEGDHQNVVHGQTVKAASFSVTTNDHHGSWGSPTTAWCREALW